MIEPKQVWPLLALEHPESVFQHQERANLRGNG